MRATVNRGRLVKVGEEGRERVKRTWTSLISRRAALNGAVATAAAGSISAGWAIAQAKPLKVGLMLPYSGTYAKLGENITYAFELLIAEKGGRLGGREVQIIKLDDESR